MARPLRIEFPGAVYHVTSRGNQGLAQGDLVCTAGLVITRQRPGTATGVVFVTLEDETGYVNLIVWSSLVESQRKELLGSRLLGVIGEVQREGRVVHVLARTLEDHTPSARAPLDPGAGVSLKMKSSSTAPMLILNTALRDKGENVQSIDRPSLHGKQLPTVCGLSGTAASPAPMVRCWAYLNDPKRGPGMRPEFEKPVLDPKESVAKGWRIPAGQTLSAVAMIRIASPLKPS